MTLVQSSIFRPKYLWANIITSLVGPIIFGIYFLLLRMEMNSPDYDTNGEPAFMYVVFGILFLCAPFVFSTIFSFVSWYLIKNRSYSAAKFRGLSLFVLAGVTLAIVLIVIAATSGQLQKNRIVDFFDVTLRIWGIVVVVCSLALLPFGLLWKYLAK